MFQLELPRSWRWRVACIENDKSERRCAVVWLTVIAGMALFYAGMAVYLYLGFQKMPL
jgi:hypothetical protein